MSIEFMLLIVIVLMYVQAIIQPAVRGAEMGVTDTIRVSQAKFAAQKLVNAIDYAGASTSQTKMAIKLFVPANTTLGCDTSDPIQAKINFSVRVQGSYGICSADSCSGSIELKKGLSIDCSAISGILGTESEENRLISVEVERQEDGTVKIA
jgi:hypothetical protein